LRRLEKLKQPSRGRNSEVEELFSLGLLNEIITIVYPHKTNPIVYTCPNPFNS
jgi:hypothetical protein